jgi:hypothetical protein
MEDIISEEDIIGWNDMNSIDSFHTQKGGDAPRVNVGFVCGQYLFNYILQEEKFVWRPDNKYLYINGDKDGDPKDTTTKINLVIGYVEFVYLLQSSNDTYINNTLFVPNIIYKLLHNKKIIPSDFPSPSKYDSDDRREEFIDLIKKRISTGKYNHMNKDELGNVWLKESYTNIFKNFNVDIFEIVPTVFDKSWIIETYSDRLGMKNINNYNMSFPILINIFKEQFTKDMFIGATILTEKVSLILIMYDDVCEKTRCQMVKENKPSKDYPYALVNSLTCTKEHPQSCVTESEFMTILESLDLTKDDYITWFFAYPQYQNEVYTPYQSVAYKRMMAAVLEKAGTVPKKEEPKKEEPKKEEPKEEEPKEEEDKPDANIPQPDVRPALQYDPNFFEKQESSGCGRHALNNLFGGKYFLKDNGSIITDTTLNQLQPPISLLSMCRYLATKGRVRNPDERGEVCPANENYEDEVLISALNVLGYRGELVIDIDSLRLIPDGLVGYIINTPGHWITLRHTSQGFIKIDSMNPTKSVFDINIIINEIKGKNKIQEQKYRSIIRVIYAGHYINPLENNA